MTSTASLLTLLTRLCWDQGDLDLLNAQLTVMSKKHGQLKEAVVRMVDEAIKWLPELKRRKDAGDYKAPGQKDRWLELVQTLRDITEGKVSPHGTNCGYSQTDGRKIYLELPRARLTVMLATYHEDMAASAPAEAESSSQSINVPRELCADRKQQRLQRPRLLPRRRQAGTRRRRRRSRSQHEIIRTSLPTS